MKYFHFSNTDPYYHLYYRRIDKIAVVKLFAQPNLTYYSYLFISQPFPLLKYLSSHQ